jgi:cell division protein FtsL
MKKGGILSEKICVTAASQCNPNKAPVRITVHRLGLIIASAVLVLAFVFCVYTVVDSLLTIQRVSAESNALRQTLEAQSGQLETYSQQIGEMEQTVSDADAAGTAGDGTEPQQSETPETVLVRQ